MQAKGLCGQPPLPGQYTCLQPLESHALSTPTIVYVPRITPGNKNVPLTHPTDYIGKPGARCVLSPSCRKCPIVHVSRVTAEALAGIADRNKLAQLPRIAAR